MSSGSIFTASARYSLSIPLVCVRLTGRNAKLGRLFYTRLA